MIRPRSLVLLALVLALSCLVFVVAEDQPKGDAASKPKGQASPEAKKVLDAFAAYMQRLKAFSVESVSEIKGDVLGQKIDVQVTQQIRAARPNRVYLNVESNQPLSGAKVVSDGEEMLVYLAPVKKYALEKAPASLGELLDNPILMGLSSAGNAGVVTAALLSDDPAAKLLENSESVQYAGTVEVEGTKAHHLKGSGQFDWDLYIGAGDKPLPIKFVPDLTKVFKRLVAQANPQKADAPEPKVENIIRFEKWNTQPKFDAESFALNAPEGAEKVGSILEMFSRPQRSQPEAESLVGQDAPQFELETLDGGQFKLADQKNKNVVILDFWATWCGPCRRAMPIISKVAGQYKDKGVIFFAVNIDEDADTIKQFLKDEELEVPVVLDKGGEVAKQYLASAIPQTVLVGKDGRVQVVHVGLLPNLEEQLGGELDALIDGKDLAAENAEKKEAAAEADEPSEPPAPKKLKLKSPAAPK